MSGSVIDKKAEQVVKAILEIVPGSRRIRTMPAARDPIALSYPHINEDQIIEIMDRCGLEKQEGIEWPNADGEYYLEFDRREQEDDQWAILLICFDKDSVMGNSNY